ncbi:MAG: nucleotide exchange factor GrpE [Planctomycetes bacterium]|nr:nucleotide exchange factor GrpE [Planctomycetota bacterium]
MDSEKETKKNKKQDSQAKKTKADKQMEQLQEQIDRLETEKQDLFEKLQRVGADYANYQKRTPKQIADSVAYEKKAIIRSLLPSLDNFAHALASSKTASGNEAENGVIKGVKLVFEHMLDAIKAQGVEQIEAQGHEFNPMVHEAVQMRCEKDKPDNIVLEDFQAGYTLNGQVIRPSKVIVNKIPTEAPAQDENKTEDTNNGQSGDEE